MYIDGARLSGDEVPTFRDDDLVQAKNLHPRRLREKMIPVHQFFRCTRRSPLYHPAKVRSRRGFEEVRSGTAQKCYGKMPACVNQLVSITGGGDGGMDADDELSPD